MRLSVTPNSRMAIIFTGVRLLLERFFRGGVEDFSDMAGELLALASGSHHSLFDCVDDRGKSGFKHRLTQDGVGCEEASNNFFRFCASQEELDQRFQAAPKEPAPILEHICAMTGDEASGERYNQETALAVSKTLSIVKNNKSRPPCGGRGLK